LIRALVVGGLVTAAAVFVFSAGWRQPFVARNAGTALWFGAICALCMGVFLRAHSARRGASPGTRVFDARIIAAAAVPGMLFTVVLVLGGAIPVSGFILLAAGVLGGGVSSLLYYPRQFDPDSPGGRQ
jgi:hypothetical protein